MTKIFQTFLLVLFFAAGIHKISCAGVNAANKTTSSEKVSAATHQPNSLKAKYWKLPLCIKFKTPLLHIIIQGSQLAS